MQQAGGIDGSRRSMQRCPCPACDMPEPPCTCQQAMRGMLSFGLGVCGSKRPLSDGWLTCKWVAVRRVTRWSTPGPHTHRHLGGPAPGTSSERLPSIFAEAQDTRLRPYPLRVPALLGVAVPACGATQVQNGCLRRTSCTSCLVSVACPRVHRWTSVSRPRPTVAASPAQAAGCSAAGPVRLERHDQAGLRSVHCSRVAHVRSAPSCNRSSGHRSGRWCARMLGRMGGGGGGLTATSAPVMFRPAKRARLESLGHSHLAHRLLSRVGSGEMRPTTAQQTALDAVRDGLGSQAAQALSSLGNDGKPLLCKIPWSCVLRWRCDLGPSAHDRQERLDPWWCHSPCMQQFVQWRHGRHAAICPVVLPFPAHAPCLPAGQVSSEHQARLARLASKLARARTGAARRVRASLGRGLRTRHRRALAPATPVALCPTFGEPVHL